MTGTLRLMVPNPGNQSQANGGNNKKVIMRQPVPFSLSLLSVRALQGSLSPPEGQVYVAPNSWKTQAGVGRRRADFSIKNSPELYMEHPIHTSPSSPLPTHTHSSDAALLLSTPRSHTALFRQARKNDTAS